MHWESDQGTQAYNNIMTNESGQERTTRKVQSLDLPACNATNIDAVATDI